MWKKEAINKVTENTTIDIPQAMIDTELDRMVQEFGQRIQQQGLDLQTYFQISGQDESQLREQMKDDAEQRVKTNHYQQLQMKKISKSQMKILIKN